MTLFGVAGSGKSTLINTLVTIIRKITQKTNSVYVCGPTGTAAFSAGGVTCHRLFCIKGTLNKFDLSAQALKALIAGLLSHPKSKFSQNHPQPHLCPPHHHHAKCKSPHTQPSRHQHRPQLKSPPIPSLEIRSFQKQTLFVYIFTTNTLYTKPMLCKNSSSSSQT